MGTRADFYIGRGPKAEWLGSVAWDGNEWDEDKKCALRKAKTAAEFGAAVIEIASEREDFTHPEDGWPWPWDDSRTTDYAYVFHEGKVSVYEFGYGKKQNKNGPKVDWFPDMKSRKRVATGHKSGLIVIVRRED